MITINQYSSGTMESISKSVQTFSDTLSKLAPLEATTGNIIDRQTLLMEVKNDKEHSLWQLQERLFTTFMNYTFERLYTATNILLEGSNEFLDVQIPRSSFKCFDH